jgi:hypothetical protein
LPELKNPRSLRAKILGSPLGRSRCSIRQAVAAPLVLLYGLFPSQRTERRWLSAGRQDYETYTDINDIALVGIHLPQLDTDWWKAALASHRRR